MNTINTQKETKMTKQTTLEEEFEAFLQDDEGACIRDAMRKSGDKHLVNLAKKLTNAQAFRMRQLITSA